MRINSVSDVKGFCKNKKCCAVINGMAFCAPTCIFTIVIDNSFMKKQKNVAHFGQ